MNDMIAVIGHRSRMSDQNGISVWRVNPDTGAFQRLSAELASWMIGFQHVSENGMLYLLDEVSEQNGQPGGRIGSVRIDRETGTVRLLNEKRTLFANPSGVCVTGDGKFAVVTHHGGMGKIVTVVKTGTGFDSKWQADSAPLCLFRLREDGSLGELCDVWETPGTQNGKAAVHLHIVVKDRKSSLIAVTDKGRRTLYLFRVDSRAEKLVLVGQASSQEDRSPRYCVFHPKQDILYINNESSAIVSAWRYERSDGSLSRIADLNLYPGEPPFEEGFLGPSDIQISPDGRFLVVSVRTRDEVAAIALEEDGTMVMTDRVSCGGKNPRSLCVAPDGQTIYVCNTDSDGIARLSVSKEGKLTISGTEEGIPHPANMLFLP